MPFFSSDNPRIVSYYRSTTPCTLGFAEYGRWWRNWICFPKGLCIHGESTPVTACAGHSFRWHRAEKSAWLLLPAPGWLSACSPSYRNPISDYFPKHGRSWWTAESQILTARIVFELRPVPHQPWRSAETHYRCPVCWYYHFGTVHPHCCPAALVYIGCCPVCCGKNGIFLLW